MKGKFLSGAIAGMVIAGAIGGAFFWGYHLNSDNATPPQTAQTTLSANNSGDEAEAASNKNPVEENEGEVESANAEEKPFSIALGPNSATLELETADGEFKTFEDITSGEMLPFHYSPSGEKVLLTPQNGFESGSYLYIYTPENGLEEIINAENTSEHPYNPSGAIWLDDRYILLLSSYSLGTVISGSVSVYDTETKEEKDINLFEGDAVTDISIASLADHPIVILSGIKFTDTIGNNNEPHVEFHKIEDILQQLKTM